MSNGECDNTGPDGSGDVGQSSTSDHTTVEQPGQPSEPADTQVQTVTSQPSDDLSSLQESLVDQEQNQNAPTSRIGLESTSIPSVFSPTPVRYFNPSQNLMFPSQIIDDDNDSQTFPYVCYAGDSYLCQTSYAVLISGRDIHNINFETICQNDVLAMQSILGGPNGTIPINNIYRITPNENNTEREIENIYSHITTNRATRLFWYYSGHRLTVRNDYREISTSDRQGNALTGLRMKAFIESLMPDCTNLMMILDCCSAGEIENLLLPILAADFMPERIHIQWCACRAGGDTYTNDSLDSEFTHCIISALTYTPDCPNTDANCPLCSVFRRACSQTGRFTWNDLMEYVHNHIDHSHYNYAPTDLPVFMMNPEPRHVTLGSTSSNTSSSSEMSGE